VIDTSNQRLQGTLRRVAAEVEVQIKELTALLKERVMAQAADAVECIGLIRRLSGPVADLQVSDTAHGAHPVDPLTFHSFHQEDKPPWHKNPFRSGSFASCFALLCCGLQ